MGKKGFTLVEVLVVMVIMAILATIAIPTYRGYLKRSYRSEAMTNLQNLRLLEERWYAQNGTYVSWDCNAGQTPSDVGGIFSSFPSSNLKFKYCIELNKDINGIDQIPCYHIVATGVDSQVQGETFEIDCNNNRDNNVGITW